MQRMQQRCYTRGTSDRARAFASACSRTHREAFNYSKNITRAKTPSTPATLGVIHTMMTMMCWVYCIQYVHEGTTTQRPTCGYILAWVLPVSGWGGGLVPPAAAAASVAAARTCMHACILRMDAYKCAAKMVHAQHLSRVNLRAPRTHNHCTATHKKPRTNIHIHTPSVIRITLHAVVPR